MCITIPFVFKTVILKKKNLIIIYSEGFNKYFCLYFNTKILKYAKGTNSLERTIHYYEKKKDIMEHILQNIIKSWEYYFYKKFKFKSKGLKIKRRRKKCLKFLFWLSHIHVAKILNCKLKRIGKQKYLFINTNWIRLQIICKKLRSVRPNDLFTKKGIRLGRQITLKKNGKKEAKKKW